MERYVFSLILAYPPEQRRVATVQGVQPDLSERADRRKVIVHREAPNLAEAVLAVIDDLEAADLQPVRVCDGDWVTLADIAARIGRSREIVRLWSIGRQGPGGFPPPLNPGCDTRFYSWSEVSHWLRRRMGYELPDPGPDLVVANLLLQARRLALRVHNREALGAWLAPYLSGKTAGTVERLPSGRGDRARTSTPTSARPAA
jgi:hypothetical protein